MKNALVVINPNASKGKGEAKAKRISEYFKEAGWNCTVAYTQGTGHAEKLAKSGAENGFKTIYSNLQTAEFVSEGQTIEKGQIIGSVGDNAAFEIADDPHLHFEMTKDGTNVNPSTYWEK